MTRHATSILTLTELAGDCTGLTADYTGIFADHAAGLRSVHRIHGCSCGAQR